MNQSRVLGEARGGAASPKRSEGRLGEAEHLQIFDNKTINLLVKASVKSWRFSSRK